MDDKINKKVYAILKDNRGQLPRFYRTVSRVFDIKRVSDTLDIIQRIINLKVATLSILVAIIFQIALSVTNTIIGITGKYMLRSHFIIVFIIVYIILFIIRVIKNKIR